jgi:hypothetical protein
MNKSVVVQTPRSSHNFYTFTLIIYSCAVQWSELHNRCWSSLLQHTWQPGPTQVRRNQCCGFILIESGSGFRLFSESGFRYRFLITKNMYIFTVEKNQILWRNFMRHSKTSTSKNNILHFLFFIVAHSYLAGSNPRIRNTGRSYYQICLAMLGLVWVYDCQGNFMISDESHSISYMHRPFMNVV